ncbi:MAG: AI-2E family transporter [Pseudomonadota bacterium]
MTVQRQILFWALTALIFIAFVYIFRSILLPFVAGMAIAYLLDPAADWFERRGFSRLWATLTITVIALTIFVLALVLIVPLLVSQAIGLIDALRPYIPDTLRTLFGLADDDFRAIQALLAPSTEEDLAARSALLPTDFSFDGLLTWLGGINIDLVRSFVEENAGIMAQVGGIVFDQGAALFGLLSTLIITPIVAIYMLYDWDNLVVRIDGLLPREHADTIRDLMKKIDGVMSGFIRGQFVLAMILGGFYAIALSIVGLNFGLLIGITSGILGFIPYVGSVTGFVAAVGVALVQFWGTPFLIMVVASIYIFGQFFEGNFLQPKIVGDAVGLHPVILFFAMLAFGSLYGFVGLLIAVPVAASIGVLTRFCVARYQESVFYKGRGTRSPRARSASDGP